MSDVSIALVLAVVVLLAAVVAIALNERRLDREDATAATDYQAYLDALRDEEWELDK